MQVKPSEWKKTCRHLASPQMGVVICLLHIAVITVSSICFLLLTRMHSSRMRTVRSSGRISGVYLFRGGVPAWGGTWSQGVYLVQWGVPGPEGCTWSRGLYLVLGVYLVPGGVPGLGGVPGPGGLYLVQGGCSGSGTPVDRQTPVKT